MNTIDELKQSIDATVLSINDLSNALSVNINTIDSVTESYHQGSITTGEYLQAIQSIKDSAASIESTLQVLTARYNELTSQLQQLTSQSQVFADQSTATSNTITTETTNVVNNITNAAEEVNSTVTNVSETVNTSATESSTTINEKATETSEHVKQTSEETASDVNAKSDDVADKATETSEKVTKASDDAGKSIVETAAKVYTLQQKLESASQAAGLLSQGLAGTPFEKFGTLASTCINSLKALTMGQESLNVAMKMNPIGFIITAITSLIAIGRVLLDWFNDATEGTEGFGNKVQLLWDKFKGFCSFVVDVTIPAFKALGNALVFNFEAMQAELSKMSDSWNSYFSGVNNNVERQTRAQGQLLKVQTEANHLTKAQLKELIKETENLRLANESNASEVKIYNEALKILNDRLNTVSNSSKNLKNENTVLAPTYAELADYIKGLITEEEYANLTDSDRIKKLQELQANLQSVVSETNKLTEATKEQSNLPRSEGATVTYEEVNKETNQVETVNLTTEGPIDLEALDEETQARIDADTKLTEKLMQNQERLQAAREAAFQSYMGCTKKEFELMTAKEKAEQKAFSVTKSISSAAEALQNSGLIKSKAAVKALKVIRTASAIADTYKAAQSAFAAGMETGGPWAPAIAAAYMAAAVATGIANVAAINSSDSSSSVSASTASAAEATSPAAGTVPSYVVQSSSTVENYSQTAQNQMVNTTEQGSTTAVNNVTNSVETIVQPVLVVESLEQVQNQRVVRFEESKM